MRSDFELDSDGWDLVITDDIGIVENAAMTSQDSKFSLQLIQGEVFDDNRIGMPWLTDMVSPQVSIAAKKQIIRDVIMSTPGAIELTSVEVAVDTDSAIATCEFEGITDNGDIFGNQVSDITPPTTDSTSGIIATFDYTTRRSTGLRLQRSSTATYIDGDVLKTADVNIPRYENDGLLIEWQSTNLINYADTPNEWRLVNATKVVNPDNSITITSTNPIYPRVQMVGAGISGAPMAAGEVMTATCWVKPDTSGFAHFTIEGQSGLGTFRGNVNLATLEVIKYNPVGKVGVYSAAATMEAGLIKLVVSLSLTVAWRFSVFFIGPMVEGGAASAAGTGQSLTVVRGQIEKSSLPSSYINTTTAAVTRQPDQISLIKSGAKFLYREYIPFGSSVVTKELIEYAGEIVPLNTHLQKLKVWDRDLTANELELLGV